MAPIVDGSVYRCGRFAVQTGYDFVDLLAMPEGGGIFGIALRELRDLMFAVAHAAPCGRFDAGLFVWGGLAPGEIGLADRLRIMDRAGNTIGDILPRERAQVLYLLDAVRRVWIFERRRSGDAHRRAELAFLEVDALDSEFFRPEELNGWWCPEPPTPENRRPNPRPCGQGEE